ncbi:MAG: peptidoglycan bridge formation glycyltransferase FemA/FemB family protein [Treponema sp.]|nr:peptidoglycan bridge formation glycyltransferase FemA/FemB family protein [Treponema sp.]
MQIRSITDNEKDIYDEAVTHPLQSYDWGEFKKTTGQNIERFGLFENDKMINAFQASFHKIPFIGSTVGYIPKGCMPDSEQLDALKEFAYRQKAIFIKLEPNVAHPADTSSVINNIRNSFEQERNFLLQNGAVHGKNLFTKYNFHLDLTPGIDELFDNLRSKTRYNVRLAVKKGVQVVEDTSESGMETYIRLMQETTSRQRFYSHAPQYYRTMWETIGCKANSMLHIFHAIYNGQVLAAWIIFLFNSKLYYPYGASSDAFREVMASNLIMWEVIKYGHENKCSCFDMWGSLGPNPDAKDPWYGFHRFKEGYNPVLMENIGTYDIVYNKFLYKSFNAADKLRWFILRTFHR